MTQQRITRESAKCESHRYRDSMSENLVIMLTHNKTLARLAAC